MKNRCYNKNNNSYKNYGGRGIKMCEKWKNNFEYFYNDMGKNPGKRYNIDRINNDGDYEPGNCRWATLEENARNKRNNVIDVEGVKNIRKLYKEGKTSWEIYKMYNMSYTNIKDIIRKKIWRNI